MKLLLFFAALAVYAQGETRIAQKSPDTGYQFIMGYSGTNMTYLCKAKSLQPTSANISVASATNASPVVFTISGGHGFNAATSPSAKPIITVSGGTGNWTAVNGSFTATILSSTTLSIPVDSTAFGALAGTVVFTTRAPLTTRPIWSVLVLTYDGSNNNTGTAWVGGVSSETNTCTGAPTQYQ